MKPISATTIITTVFLGSAFFLFAAAPWLAPEPVAEATLARMEGVIEKAEQTNHPKEPSGAFSAALLIRDAQGETRWLHTVKADVAEETGPTLVGRRIDALYSGKRIYAMTVDGTPLFTYADTRAVFERDKWVVRSAAWTSFAIGAALLLFVAWRKIRARLAPRSSRS